MILAPMAGVSCTAFRLLCKRYGADRIYTQMYHADFLCHKQDSHESIAEYIDIREEERPVSIQLVGHNPENMGRAAKLVEPLADLVDINFGCCDPAMIKSGAGAYYAKYPEKIPSVVKAVMDAVKKPVTAKIRIGYDSQHINGVAVAQMLEELGISEIAVHGRVATQKYSGKANWQIIKHIKQKLRIPVIGNGDVRCREDALRLIETTGCDEVMVGRRAMGDPGIFAELKGQEKPPVAEQFLEFSKLHAGGFSEFRTHALWFAKRAKLGPQNRNLIMKSKQREDILKLFTSKS